jgi:competence protein ComEA
MNPEKKPLLKWFGYSRRERRSTFMLLLLILIIIALRYLVPERNLVIEEVAANPFINMELPGLDLHDADTLKPFNFDPNKTSFGTLVRLGLSEKQAKTILSYRKKGGRFLRPTDLSKIYGIEEDISKKLIPYIIIEKDTVLSEQKGVFNRQMIDLNNCDSALLDHLPGIGPVLSARIIKYRNLLGGFASKGQLKEVYGLSEETYTLITDRVFADSTVITRIKINVAEYKDIIKHPYFERYEVQVILKYRELQGRISDMSELTNNKLLTAEKAKKIKPYLIF